MSDYQQAVSRRRRAVSLDARGGKVPLARFRAWPAVAVFLLFGVLAQAAAQVPPTVVRTRSPATIMSFRGAEWLERPQRVTEERPDQVLEVMGLRPGDVVADVGAGSGYFTRRIAPRVAPGGTVFAVDVQNEMLDLLIESVEQEGLEGVVPILGADDDPRLPSGTVDWILLVDVYHEFSNPTAMLARMREALAPDGRVALIEYRAEDGTGDHIRAEHRMSARQVLAEWKAAGFELVELHEFLPSQHLFILRAARTLADASSSSRLPDYDLFEAMRAGVLEVTATGAGGDRLTLTVRRTRPENMVVTLPAGAVFTAPGPAGDMAARRDGVIVLRDDRPRRWQIEGRRIEHSAPAPGPQDRLAPSFVPRPDIADLMWMFQVSDVFPGVAPTVEQIALWILTEDLGWEALSAHARSTSVHAANAVALGAAYVNGSGFDIRSRRIWRERASFASQISDQGLRRFFETLEAN
jgi:predicted methyltransferase